MLCKKTIYNPTKMFYNGCMKKQPTVFVAARITEAQQAIVLETAQRMPGAVTGNFSAALRFIIEDWAAMHAQTEKEQKQ